MRTSHYFEHMDYMHYSMRSESYFAQELVSNVIEIFLCARIISFVLDNLLCVPRLLFCVLGLLFPAHSLLFRK